MCISSEERNICVFVYEKESMLMYISTGEIIHSSGDLEHPRDQVVGVKGLRCHRCLSFSI